MSRDHMSRDHMPRDHMSRDHMSRDHMSRDHTNSLLMLCSKKINPSKRLFTGTHPFPTNATTGHPK